MGRVVGRELAAVGSELGKGRVPSGTCVALTGLGQPHCRSKTGWLNPHQRLAGGKGEVCGGHGWPGQAVRRLLGLCPVPASTCPLCSRALRSQRERTSNPKYGNIRGEQAEAALTVPQSSLQFPRSPSRGPAAPKRRGPRNERASSMWCVGRGRPACTALAPNRLRPARGRRSGQALGVGHTHTNATLRAIYWVALAARAGCWWLGLGKGWLGLGAGRWRSGGQGRAGQGRAGQGQDVVVCPLDVHMIPP